MIVLDTFDTSCVPSDTSAVGALIERAPEVSVKLAFEAALAGVPDAA